MDEESTPVPPVPVPDKPPPGPEPAPGVAEGGQVQGSAQERGLTAVKTNPVTARTFNALRGRRG